MKLIVSVLFFLFLFSACKNPSDKQDDQGHGHDHGAISILLFEGGMELFAESDQLFAGHGVEIRAHLTFLENYKPAEKGILYARLAEGENVPDWEPLELLQPGIFTGTLIPGEGGTADFQFKYEEDDINVLFVEESIAVYTHDDTPPEPAPHGDELIFTKEQAWKTEFGLMEVELREFASQIHCSGEVFISPSGKLDIIAPASGKLAFTSEDLIEGRFVREGSVLFTILGTGLSHDNILLELNTARTEYEKSKADKERKEKLLAIEAVSKSAFEEANAIFEQDKARYDLLISMVSEAGMSVKSPISGFISEILVSDNSYAETGSVLIKLLKTDGVMIKANVPAEYSGSIASIKTANIKFPGSNSIIALDEIGGKVVSFGHSVEIQTGMIPLYISLNKPDIIAGTFVELWLSPDLKSNQLLVPNTSLLEEYGQYYVYVQEEGEAYEKRAVKIGQSDGLYSHVLGGLETGEVIVSKGGMAIKVANAMGSAPVHQH